MGGCRAGLERRYCGGASLCRNRRSYRAISLPQGLYQLTLDNGQVWQTREADWTLVFKSDDAIVISRLPLGGYQISKPGNGRSVGAKRIQ